MKATPVKQPLKSSTVDFLSKPLAMKRSSPASARNQNLSCMGMNSNTHPIAMAKAAHKYTMLRALFEEPLEAAGSATRDQILANNQARARSAAMGTSPCAQTGPSRR